MTLLEIAVVLALLALMAALVAPSLVTRSPSAPTLDDVVTSARANAIARAQTLALSIGISGEWTLSPLPPDDTLTVLSGLLERAPAQAILVTLLPLGSCSASDAASGAALAWDAARCQPPRQEAQQ